MTYFTLITSAGPTFLSLINYLIPLWAVAVGAIFLRERPDWNALLALGLILSGIALTQRADRRISQTCGQAAIMEGKIAD